MKSKFTLRVAAILLLAIGAILVVLFGLRTFHALRGFRGRPPMRPPDKIETDVEHIRDWMTVPFVAHMYHVQGFVLFEALQIPPQGNDNKSLLNLNREYYPNDSGYVIETIRKAVQDNLPPLPPGTDSAPAPSFPPTPSQP